MTTTTATPIDVETITGVIDTGLRAAGMTGTIAEDGRAILIDVADPTGANGMRTFVVKAREVDAPEGIRHADIDTLTALLTSYARTIGVDGSTDALARFLLDAGVTV